MGTRDRLDEIAMYLFSLNQSGSQAAGSCRM
jgi:hypothetical protein